MDHPSNSNMDLSSGSSGSVDGVGGEKPQRRPIFDLNFPSAQYDFPEDVSQPADVIPKRSPQAEVVPEALPLPEPLPPLRSGEEEAVQNNSDNGVVGDHLFLSEKSKEKLPQFVDGVSLPDMLTHLRQLAIHPCFLMMSKIGKNTCRSLNLVLNTRRALYPKVETKTAKALGFPYQKVEPEPMSWEYLCRIGLTTRPIRPTPVGPSFQADLPIWTGSSSSSKSAEIGDGKDLDSSRFLGTQLWPMPGANNEKNMELIGKGRDESCLCPHSGSSGCISYHKKMKNLELKSELHEAYSHMGFETMGDQASESWSFKEQMEFDKIVRENLMSENRDFFSVALKHFPKKTKEELVSYYYNVHVRRRMVVQTGLETVEVDSEDDEVAGKTFDSLVKTVDGKRAPKVKKRGGRTTKNTRKSNNIIIYR